MVGLLQSLSINWTYLRLLLFVSDSVQVCLSPRLSSVDLHCCAERVMWNVWAMSKYLHDLRYKEELTLCWYKVDPLCFLLSVFLIEMHSRGTDWFESHLCLFSVPRQTAVLSYGPLYHRVCTNQI